MPSIRRALSVITLLTAFAATAMHMQARALERTIADRQARAVRAAAMDLGSEELIRAEAELRAGRTPAGTRDVETRQGRLRVATAIERQATRRHLVRISVADHGGQVLSTYETVVEVERR